MRKESKNSFTVSNHYLDHFIMLYWIVPVGELIHVMTCHAKPNPVHLKSDGPNRPSRPVLNQFFSEYLFICDFFLPSEQAKITMFNMIFSQILQTLISHLETYLADCWDAIALFLCIHIILK